MKNSKFKYLAVGVSGVVGCAMATVAFAQQAQVTEQDGVTTITLPDRGPQAGGGIDYKNAIPLPLPSVRTPVGSPVDSASDVYLGEPGRSQGSQGDGKMKPEVLIPRSELKSLNGAGLLGEGVDEGGVEPQEYGTSNHPYTTSRVDIPSNQVSKYYPFRPAGKVFFKKPGDSRTWICSASLIKRGVVVTAAHCVSNYGKKQYYTNIEFIPAYYNGIAPYGRWTARNIRIMSSYYNGTDVCATAGVVCRNDVAVLTVNPKTNPTYPGTSTGWYGYGWNGWGFVGGKTQITQLGYPGSHDSGQMMQRTESQGFVSAASASNTVIGSRQTGGSSGGPWLVNLGSPASLTPGEASYGTYPNYNIVVGATSWGYISLSPKQQGASPFLSTNIVPLVSSACSALPSACL